MTANRWWVRLFARWQARINSVKGQINLVFSGMTGLGVTSGALKYYGLEQFTPFFILATVGGIALYAYYYSEGGVWNQASKDQTDLADNYSGPTMLMDARIEMKQLAYLGYVVQNGGGKQYDEILDEMEELTHEEWAALRDGVDIDKIEEQA